MVCTLCPHRCRVQRTEQTGSGFCHMPLLPVVARAAPHFWRNPASAAQEALVRCFSAGAHCVAVFVKTRKSVKQA